MDLSLVVSIIALILAVYTYFTHDSKLKRQEHLLNEYKLSKITEEQAEGKKAIIRANIIKGTLGKRTIKVYNAGKSRATNVNVLWPSGNDMLHIFNEDIFPYEFINPQDNTELNVLIANDNVSTVKIHLTWDDAYKSGNIQEQILTL
jgi:hypothetical protein